VVKTTWKSGEKPHFGTVWPSPPVPLTRSVLRNREAARTADRRRDGSTSFGNSLHKEPRFFWSAPKSTSGRSTRIHPSNYVGFLPNRQNGYQGTKLLACDVPLIFSDASGKLEAETGKLMMFQGLSLFQTKDIGCRRYTFPPDIQKALHLSHSAQFRAFHFYERLLKLHFNISATDSVPWQWLKIGLWGNHWNCYAVIFYMLFRAFKDVLHQAHDIRYLFIHRNRYSSSMSLWTVANRGA